MSKLEILEQLGKMVDALDKSKDSSVDKNSVISTTTVKRMTMAEYQAKKAAEDGNKI